MKSTTSSGSSLGAGCPKNHTVTIAIFFSFFLHLLQAAKQLNSIPDISFHENKKSPQTQGREWGKRLSIKREQAGWRQLGFSIQFSCPEPWQTG